MKLYFTADKILHHHYIYIQVQCTPPSFNSCNMQIYITQPPSNLLKSALVSVIAICLYVIRNTWPILIKDHNFKKMFLNRTRNSSVVFTFFYMEEREAVKNLPISFFFTTFINSENTYLGCQLAVQLLPDFGFRHIFIQLERVGVTKGSQVSHLKRFFKTVRSLLHFIEILFVSALYSLLIMK